MLWVRSLVVYTGVVVVDLANDDVTTPHGHLHRQHRRLMVRADGDDDDEDSNRTLEGYRIPGSWNHWYLRYRIGRYRSRPELSQNLRLPQRKVSFFF